MENKTIGIIVGAVILIIVGYMVYNSGPVVSAQGTSEIEVSPDEVSVNINVQTKNATLEDAQAQNEEISDRLVAELVDAGFNEDELRFVNYNAYEDYDYSVFVGGSPRKNGYVVSQQLVVETSDVDRVPRIVSAVIDAGALVQYIQFEISDERQDEYKRQALEEASRDAREKARAIAEGQGRSLGRLVSIQNQEFYYPGPVAFFDKGVAEASGAASDSAINAEAARVASSITVDPQEIVVTANIVAQYKLFIF